MNGPRPSPATPDEIDSFIEDFINIFGRLPTDEELKYLRFAQQLMREEEMEDAAMADD